MGFPGVGGLEVIQMEKHSPGHVESCPPVLATCTERWCPTCRGLPCTVLAPSVFEAGVSSSLEAWVGLLSCLLHIFFALLQMW